MPKPVLAPLPEATAQALFAAAMTALRSGERGQAERHLRQLFLRYGLDPDPDTMVLVAQGRLALASALAYRGQRASALTLYAILRKQSTTFHDPRAETIFATALYNEAMLCALEEPATAAARFAALLKRFAGSENERVRLLVAKAGLARGRLLPAEALPMAQAVEKRFDRSLLPDSKAARAIRVAETNYPWPDHRPARAIFTDSSALDTQEDLALAHQVDLALEVQYRALGETGRYAEQIEVIDSLLARAPVTHRPDIRRLPTTWQTLFRDALSARAVALDHLDQAAAAIAAFTTLVEWTWSAHDALSENALAGALVNRTIIEIKSGQPATALQTGGAFLGRFRWTRDPGVARERFKLLLLIGQLQAQTGHPAEALSIFRAMERSLAEKLDPALAELAARSLHKMVTLLSQAGALPEAALICRALITRFAKEEWPAIEEAVAAALIELGEIEEKRGDLTAEAAVYEELFARFGPRNGDNDNPALAPFLAFGRLRQAGMRKRAGDAEGAIALRRAFIARYESSDNETIAGYVLDEGIRLGDALGQQGDRAGEIAVYEPLLARYAQTEFPRVQAQLAATWFAKAYAQEKAGDHEAEIATYAALATALGDSTLPAVQVYIAWAICNRAMTLVRQDRAPEAIVDFVEPMARFEAQIQENPEANPGLGEPVAKFFYQRAFLFSESGQHRAALAEHMALAERLAHHPARSVRERVLRSRYRVAGLLAQLSTTPGEAAAVFLGAEEARQADPESADDPFVANLRSAYLSGQMVTDEAERSLLDNRSHLPAETNSAARIAGLIMQALAASLEEHYAEAAALCDEAERLARDAEIPVPVEVLLIRLKIAIDNDRSDEATTLISVLRADPRVQSSIDKQNILVFYENALASLSDDGESQAEEEATRNTWREMARGEGLSGVAGVAALFLAQDSEEEEEALSWAERAVELLQPQGSPLLALALVKVASLLVERDPERAARLARESVGAADRLRESLRAPTTRLHQGAYLQETYRAAIRTLLDTGHPTEACEILAHYQGRLLYEEQLATAPVSDGAMSLSPGEQAELAAAALTRGQAQRAVDQELGRRPAGETEPGRQREIAESAPVSPAGLALRAAEEQYETLLRLATLRSLPVRPPVVIDFGYADLARAVGERGLALVLLAWEDDLHLAFVLIPEGRSARLAVIDYDESVPSSEDQSASNAGSQPPDEKSASAYIEEYLETLQTVAEGLDTDDPLPELAWRRLLLGGLGRTLWEPIAQAVGPLAVRLVPAAALGSVPFAWIAAQRSPAQVVTLLPGAAWLLSRHPSPASESDPGSVRPDVPGVISGEETFPAGGSVLALAGSANRDLPGVDHTLTLTRALSRYPVGASASRIVPPADDPYSALLTDPGPYDFLLVASHMRSAERPERTAVRLPRPDPDHPGEYLAFDISSLELLNGVRPHIRRAVILAGCSSAQAAGGSDLVSLAAVLLHASGAPAVLAAHLPVSDFWATLLWAELFERLRTGRSLAAALAEAQAVLAEVRADSWPRYLAALRERFPDPACSVFLDWAAARLAEAASRITAGSLMPLPDRAAWTILERT